MASPIQFMGENFAHIAGLTSDILELNKYANSDGQIPIDILTASGAKVASGSIQLITSKAGVVGFFGGVSFVCTSVKI